MGTYAEPVAVLDGHLRHALALIRSLGRHGVRVLAVSHLTHHPARVSRHCWRSAVLDLAATPSDDPGAFLRLMTEHGVRAVIPAGLPGNEFLCRHRALLEPRFAATYNDLATFEILARKDRTVALARELDVPCPRSHILADGDALAAAAAGLQFPVVFKSTVDQGTVRYARDADELNACWREFRTANPALIAGGRHPLAQEYIEGDGHGFYGLARDGEVLVHFMHRRLHEVPPSGGPSAMAASYHDDELRELGCRFFAATRWNGPAMVEFKKSRRDGRYYLIEVNPKFWGSLELGISAGVDFPRHTLELISGQPLTARPGAYARNHVFRWLTMDLAHSVQARRLHRYVLDFANRRIHDDWHWDDPLPLVVMFAQGIRRFR